MFKFKFIAMFLIAVFLAVACVLFATGCSSTADGTSGSSTLQSLVDGALDVGAQILGNEGFQQAAILAAQNFVAGQTDDPQLQQAANAAIAAGIPALATAFSSAAAKSPGFTLDKSARVAAINQALPKVKTDAYKVALIYLDSHSRR